MKCIICKKTVKLITPPRKDICSENCFSALKKQFADSIAYHNEQMGLTGVDRKPPQHSASQTPRSQRSVGKW